MRRLIRVGAGLLLMVAFASPLHAQAYTAGTGLADSPHDFSDGVSVVGTSTANNEGTWNPSNHICQVCHAPHNANTAQPLWDHTVTGATFTPYTNASINATDLAAPDGVSKLCLSCHDGVTNLAGFNGGVGVETIGVGYPAAVNFGIDLQDDHPISFTYNDALATADGELHAPTSTLSGLGLNIDDDLLFGTGNDQVECASCHDVHNGTGTLAKLLVITNSGSALCLTCHDK